VLNWYFFNILFSCFCAGVLNITAHNTSSTSVQVTWGLLPYDDVISYHATLNDTMYTITCNATTSSVEFSGLKKFTSYCARVLVVTVSGRGNASDCVDVTTDEDGEKMCLVYLSHDVSNVKLLWKIMFFIWQIPFVLIKFHICSKILLAYAPFTPKLV